MKNSTSFNSTLNKFGIGLFETIKVKNGEVKDLDLHMDRMFKSISELDLSINIRCEDIDLGNENIKSEDRSSLQYLIYMRSFLEQKILEYIKQEQIVNKALRLTIFDDGYNISVRNIPYDESSYKRGFRLNISPIKRGDSIIYRHKTTNYFESIYTKNYANKKGFDDGIFLDLNGMVLECSMSNIFFIRGNTIYTPKSDLPILNGTMKQKVLNICNDTSIDLREDVIKLEELDKFDFVFITNSLMELMKVTEIDGIFYDRKNYLFDKILDCLY